MKHRVIIYICDDDIRFLEIASFEIERIAKEKGQECNILKFSNAKELLERYRKVPSDIVFLDIEMPDMTGFDAAAELRISNKAVDIVFLTSYDDKVYQSYEYHPFWFVRKSHMNDLNVVISRFLDKIGFQNQSTYFFDFQVNDNKCIRLDINRVVYIEAKNHYISIVDDNKEEQMIRCKMIDAEKQLDSLHFVRVQNSVIVNLRFVSKVIYKEVIMKNGIKINIGRDRVKKVKTAFQMFLLRG